MPISLLTRDRSIASYQLSQICLEKIQKMRGFFTRLRQKEFEVLAEKHLKDLRQDASIEIR